jgi:ketosteroid isomerase-like protein
MKSQDATLERPHLVRAQLYFAQALNAGDAGAAANCFARDGCLITPDATAIHSRDAVRPLLAQLVARRVEITVELSCAVGAGDVVLASERWTVRFGIDPVQPKQTLHPTLVLRRIEAEWKLAVAAPWGWGDARL